MNEYQAGAVCVADLTAAVRYALAANPPPFISRPDGCVFQGTPIVGAEYAGTVAVTVTYQPITETGSCAVSAPPPVEFAMTVPACAFGLSDSMPLAWSLAAVWLVVYGMKRIGKAVEA